MFRIRTYQWLIVLLIIFIVGVWYLLKTGPNVKAAPTPLANNIYPISPAIPQGPTASELLLTGYGDVATPPIDDLRKIQRVAIGYFSVIKNSQRSPIGGNEDFSAALRGENPNREVFLRSNHPIFSPAGLLLDRWQSPLIIHPQSWQQLELRSSGPDQIPYNADDLILSPTGISRQGI